MANKSAGKQAKIRKMRHFRAILLVSVAFAKIKGQEYTVDPLKIEKCPLLSGKRADFDMGLESESDGSKSYFFNGKIGKTANKECTFKADISLWNGVDYIPYMSVDGNLCETLQKVIKPAWQRFKSQIRPKIDDECLIKSDVAYDIKGFEMTKNDFDVVIPAGGQYKIITRVYCAETEVACFAAETLVKEDD